MRSEAQIAASRANGAKSFGPITPEGKARSAANAAYSTGPRTPEGKARSSRNAEKHAILAKSITLPDEDQGEFMELLDTYKARFQTVDLLEERAVETMVFAEWRRRRIWTFEMACIFYAAILQEASRDQIADHYIVEMPQMHCALAFSKMANNGRTLDLFCRYEAILRREYDRAYAQLKELQKDRREREANSFEPNEPGSAGDLVAGSLTEPEPVAPNVEQAIMPAMPDLSPASPNHPDPAPATAPGPEAETKRTEPEHPVYPPYKKQIVIPGFGQALFNLGRRITPFCQHLFHEFRLYNRTHARHHLLRPLAG